MKLYVFDFETMYNINIVSFLGYNKNDVHTFLIDDDTKQNDSEKLIEFIKGKTLVGYNNKTFDDLILNYIIKNPKCTAYDLHKLGSRIIEGQREDDFNIYKEFKSYIKSDLYTSIDLMRLLFSKKLRVGLKALQCSLNFRNVLEFELPFDKHLTTEEKQKCISYNINDIESTKLVLEKSIDSLKLRRWIETEYGIDTWSMDGVNGGVKILEKQYEEKIGNRDFFKDRTFREWVNIKDIILPFIKFDTIEFQSVLKMYQAHTWYSSHFDEKLFEDSKLKFEPVINGFKFKFSLGGLECVASL